MVILLFLRNFWATLIPSVTVPLALLGSFAAMYLLNFSLDNLSLMALTIAVGFVVDDAIVVVENIYRHVEHGEPPFEAALKGSREIGFTVLSISLLADRGVHSAPADGRHHRPAVPRIRPDRHRLDRGLGAGVADARADDVLALHAARSRTSTAASIASIEAGFDAMLVVLPAHARHRAAPPADHARRLLRHHGADRGHGHRDPKGLLPDPGHRHDPGLRRSRAGNLAGTDDAPDARRRRRHPARSRRRRVSARSPAPPAAPVPPIPGAIFIVLKPRDERKLTSSQIIDRLRPQLAKVAGASICSCSRPRTSRSAAASRAAASSTRLQDSNIAELNEWSQKLLEKMRTLPQLADVTERSAGQRAAAQDHHQPRPGLALRHLAAGDRRHAQRRLRPAPDHAVFHPAQDLFRGPGNPARAAEGPLDRSTAST